MVKQYRLELPDELYEKLREMAESTGRSIKDVIIESIQLRIYGQQAKPDAEMVEYTEPELRQLMYPTKCAKCGKPIPAGEIAWLSKAKYADGSERWLAWHFDCLIVDKKLSQLYVKKRYYEKVIRALKKQADELADIINEAEARKRVVDASDEVRKVAHSIENEINEAIRILRKYMEIVKPNNQKLQEIYNTLIRIRDTITDRLDAMARKLDELAVAMVKPQKRKRKEKIEEWR